MEIIKCKLIMVPKPTKKHWYFFIFLISSLCRVIFPELFIKEDVKKKFSAVNIENNEKKLQILLTQKFYEIIRNISSDLFIGIFHCIDRIKNRNESQKSTIRNSQKMYYLYNDEANKPHKKYIIIFIISFVDIICQLLIPTKYIIEAFLTKQKINDSPSYQLYFLLFFDIFARYFFSRFILKTYFYIHHYLSFFFNIIGLVPIAIVYIIEKIILNNTPHFDLLYISITTIQIILYSFEDIMNKVAFRTLYMLPNTLIFYKGSTQLIYLVIISTLIFTFNQYKTDYEIDYYRYEIINFITFVPCNIIRTIYLVKIIDKFSAQHMALLKISESVTIYIYSIVAQHVFDYQSITYYKLNYSWESILQCFGFFLLFLSSLIHNEIIIINHPKLKAKTQYYLDKDADNEQYSSCNSDTLFTESKDSSNSVTNLYSDLTGSDSS